MTTTSLVLSTQITNFDASPVVESTKGAGAPYRSKHIDADLATVTANGVNSRYRFFRIRSNTVVKGLYLRWAAMSGGTIDMGLRYPDDARYTAQTLDGAIDADFFKAGVAVTSASETDTDVTCGNVLAGAGHAKLSLPIWQAAGLTSDPGGWFDVVGTVATEITTGANIYARLEYVE